MDLHPHKHTELYKCGAKVNRVLRGTVRTERTNRCYEFKWYRLETRKAFCSFCFLFSKHFRNGLLFLPCEKLYPIRFRAHPEEGASKRRHPSVLAYNAPVIIMLSVVSVFGCDFVTDGYIS